MILYIAEAINVIEVYVTDAEVMKTDFDLR